MSAAGLSRWRVSGGFLCTAFDDLEVVYQVPSGETHFLNPISIFMVERLSASALTLAELVDAIAAEFELFADEVLQRHIESTLRRLEELGIAGAQDE